MPEIPEDQWKEMQLRLNGLANAFGLIAVISCIIGGLWLIWTAEMVVPIKLMSTGVVAVTIAGILSGLGHTKQLR
jgi:hypothetical protein